MDLQGYRDSQQASSRRSKSSGMIRVDGGWGQRQARRSGSLCNASESSQISWVLNPIDKDEDRLGRPVEGLDAASIEASDSNNSTRRIAIGNLFE